MAEVTKGVTPSLATPYPSSDKRLTLTAGEAIAAGDACYIKSDGKFWKATGASANAAAKVYGFALAAASAGDPVTCAWGVNMAYNANISGTAKNPGVELYLSGTVAGGLADAASTGGTGVIAVVIDSNRIRVMGDYK